MFRFVSGVNLTNWKSNLCVVAYVLRECWGKLINPINQPLSDLLSHDFSLYQRRISLSFRCSILNIFHFTTTIY